MENTSKVIPIRTKYALFNPELRSRLETGAKSYTDKPAETVSALEQVVCTYLAEIVRRGAESLAKKVGAIITGEKISNEQ